MPPLGEDNMLFVMGSMVKFWRDVLRLYVVQRSMLLCVEKMGANRADKGTGIIRYLCEVFSSWNR